MTTDEFVHSDVFGKILTANAILSARKEFPMQQTTNSMSAAGGHFHAVRFYQDDDSLIRMVADFLGEGLAAGEPALAIVTPEHRASLVQELRGRHFDIEQMQTAGRLLVIDARETLAAFMKDGELNGDLFRKNVMAVIDRLCQGRKDRWFRAYGEIVDLLWQDGQRATAIQLEALWNELQHTQCFAGLCGYAMGKFYTDAGAQDIHREHTHVLSTGIGPAQNSPDVVTLSPEFPSSLWHLNGLTIRPMRIAST